MRVVELARFTSAYIFQYSPRPGTPAFDLEPLPKAIVQERFERLHAFQEQITLRDSLALEGRVLDVLVLDGEGRKGKGDRLRGREPGNRLVHFTVPDGAVVPRPGDIATVLITHGAPHHLVSDASTPAREGAIAREDADAALTAYAVRRTAAGDAWEAAQSGAGQAGHSHADACGTPAPSGPVGLGLPTIRVASA
jgi:tRNA-2-methylthio-N6-dimethylallyladenosine synthase